MQVVSREFDRFEACKKCVRPLGACPSECRGSACVTTKQAQGVCNPEKCKACQGLCCLCYDSTYFEKTTDSRYAGYLHQCFPPVVDRAAISNRIGKEYEKDSRRKRNDRLEAIRKRENKIIARVYREIGLDPRACEYKGENGCILPREVRPKICLEYMCKDPLESASFYRLLTLEEYLHGLETGEYPKTVTFMGKTYTEDYFWQRRY